MDQHPVSAADPRPFTLLTVTGRPGEPGNSIDLAFRTSGSGREAHGPEVLCHTYADRTPILKLHQGDFSVSLTTAGPETAGEADVRFARAMVMGALRYYQALHQLRRGQGAAPTR
ncbi:hypothetical protein [Nocardiopsis sp. CNT312]|uniref:hypothetical protein n=1 Tax=Nocardiopsis sp. CNT312 TaxID=1137268 RepID=UPI0004B4E360|nr:hypothetical protein [Nocardiopsis sp. CNT312]